MSPDLARLLHAPAARPAPLVLLVAAHPDDETIGAGLLLRRHGNAHVLHITDGAPVDRAWWGDPAQPSREAYALARSTELRAAMACANVSGDRLECLGLIDQQASDDLASLALRVRDTLRRFRPDIVITHPYEGGHPDHDACAFAVRTACDLLAPRSERNTPGGLKSEVELAARPAIVEFVSYHARPDGGVATGEFLGGCPDEIVDIVLTPEERGLKRRMLDCFSSQRATLSQFPIDIERFRLAPLYDFTQPPHEGRLHYERFSWGVTGRVWREMAGDALAALGLRQTPPMDAI